jgi:hypothetical protein
VGSPESRSGGGLLGLGLGLVGLLRGGARGAVDGLLGVALALGEQGSDAVEGVTQGLFLCEL